MSQQYFKLILLCICLYLLPDFLSAKPMVYIHAKDTGFYFAGRYEKRRNGTVRYTQPGVSVYCSFEGTALDIVMKDFGSGSASSTNYLAVVIDGASPLVVKLNPTDTIYSISKNLTNQKHTLQIVKRTESLVGMVEFKGIQIIKGAYFGPHSALPKKKFLFIGNSITCGYGNDTSITINPSSGFTSKNEDNYNSYGYITARTLNAQYMAFAYSGRGLYKNYDGGSFGAIPTIFNRVHPDFSTPVWNSNNYIPDLIMVNLGTNDFSSETNGKGKIDSVTFVSKYLAFVSVLKILYPNAKIVLLVGTMMNDGYPAGAQQWTRIQNYVSGVVATEKKNGNNNIYNLVLTPQSSPYGEDWHPTIATHQEMSEQLVRFINANVKE
jgi:lysophospholipase L1-like esterase